MKILITGGAGFIGSNFIRYMLKKHPDYKIINFDKLTYAGNLDNLKDIENNPNYSFVKGDICDGKTVLKVAKKCDGIINFAAETHVDRAIEEAGHFLKTDVFGSHKLLEACKKLKSVRFLQISSDEVYGSVKQGSSKETDVLHPRNPYSASKAAAEMLVISYIETYNVPALITRSSNNFGPYQHPEKLIPKFIINAINNLKLPLYGNGLNVRDWLFVEDNCAAIDLVFHRGKSENIYNIGGGNERTNLEITKIILEHLNKSEDLIEYVDDRIGHDKRYSLDCTKINNLGWKPEFDFESAMKKTIKWYCDNEEWWLKVKHQENKINS